MLKRAVFILSIFVVLSCATGIPKLGTGGRKSAQKIEKTDHAVIPDGVSCYVCHKGDIPVYEFHAGYGNKCDECHDKDSWIANKYPHPAWVQNEIHKTRCTRCHTKANEHNFTFYQCYGCHHDEKDIQSSHTDYGIKEITNCIACHKNASVK